jgi:hypothetical protein
VLRAGRRRNDARMWRCQASSATPARATPDGGKRRDRSESTIFLGNPRSRQRNGSDLSRWVRFNGSDLSQDRFFSPAESSYPAIASCFARSSRGGSAVL